MKLHVQCFYTAWKLVGPLQKVSNIEYLTGHVAWPHPLRGSEVDNDDKEIQSKFSDGDLMKE